MVRAKNEAGLSVSQRFVVEVIAGEDVSAENALTVYPNPVKKRFEYFFAACIAW